MNTPVKLTDYKPSLLCRMVGHRFEFQESKRVKYEDGVWRWRHIMHTQHFCRRCGVLNPSVFGDETAKVIIKRELGL